MNKKLDLTFGNPAFLQELWDQSFGGFVSQTNSGYDSTKASQDLKEAIYALHEQVGNVKDVRNYHIVIGNGASQLLTAVSRALPMGVYAPFWSRFNYLVEDMRLFTPEWPHHNTNINLLVTYPNNPDGALSPKVLEAQVVDASYHWPQYYPSSYNLRALDNDVLLFSFSKLTGLSSSRLGWALVKSEDIARSIEHHVEMATCGVSPATQEIGAQVIDAMLDNDQEFFKEARSMLNSRWSIMADLLKDFIPFNQTGMFLYVKDVAGKINSLNVEGFNGKDFGDRSYFTRYNLGVSTEDFNEFVARLKTIQ